MICRNLKTYVGGLATIKKLSMYDSLHDYFNISKLFFLTDKMSHEKSMFSKKNSQGTKQ